MHRRLLDRPHKFDRAESDAPRPPKIAEVDDERNSGRRQGQQSVRIQKRHAEMRRPGARVASLMKCYVRRRATGAYTGGSWTERVSDFIRPPHLIEYEIGRASCRERERR